METFLLRNISLFLFDIFITYGRICAENKIIYSILWEVVEYWMYYLEGMRWYRVNNGAKWYLHLNHHGHTGVVTYSILWSESYHLLCSVNYRWWSKWFFGINLLVKLYCDWRNGLFEHLCVDFLSVEQRK